VIPPHQDTERPGDGELLELFEKRPLEAWDLFLERYAGRILGLLRRQGFDHDEAMDRFVHVCEALSESAFHRLRSVRHLGERGELLPWLRVVVANLSTSWTRSVRGRRRIFRSVRALGTLEQRVFQLYFWHGLPPSEVYERLRTEHVPSPAGEPLHPVAVLEALDTVFEHLDAGQLRRLATQLERNRPPLPLDAPEPHTGRPRQLPAPGAGPEEDLLHHELHRTLDDALEALAPRDRLILTLRFEEALGISEVAAIVGKSATTVKTSLRRSLEHLRNRLGASP
jgi:RNA polymerase sigma factor (sigma-70 family)